MVVLKKSSNILTIGGLGKTRSSSNYTRSSKASSRNPLGPALNTNGKPRAPQGSANDPQSIAARVNIFLKLKPMNEIYESFNMVAYCYDTKFLTY